VTKTRREIRKTNSLAGWLFADLSIVLALIFMSSQLQSSVSNGETIPTTTTTTLPTAEIATIYGVSVDPKEITVRISDPSNAIQIFNEIEKELKSQGVPENLKFGVVLVYAGVTDDSQDAENEARSRSTKIEESLKNWGRLTNKRWVTGKMSDKAVSYPNVKFKLLEDLSNP
jgi:hypothetical protein